MRFNVNVDYPDRRATIHSVNNPNCQPQEKQAKDGYWRKQIPTKEEVLRAAKDSGQQPHPCGLCRSYLPDLVSLVVD